MAALFLRKVAASVASSLLHLRPCAVKPRAASTVLLAPPRSARPAPPGLQPPSTAAGPLLAGCLPPRLQPALGFKNKVVIKKRCKDCYRVKRRGRWFIYCQSNPRHKQRQV